MTEEDVVKVWQTYWNKTGSLYHFPWDENEGMRLINILECRFIVECLNMLPPQARYGILDVGIGNGRIVDCFINSKNLGNKFKTADIAIYGIDYAEEMIAYCREKYKSIVQVKEIKKVDISSERIPFEQKMDFITAVRVLKYIPTWKDVLIGNIMSALKKNGIMVFSMPNKFSINRFAKTIAVIERTSVREIKEFFDGKEIEIIKIGGFSILPDKLYLISNSKVYGRFIYLFDQFLIKLFGDTLFTRILFFCIRSREQSKI